MMRSTPYSSLLFLLTACGPRSVGELPGASSDDSTDPTLLPDDTGILGDTELSSSADSTGVQPSGADEATAGATTTGATTTGETTTGEPDTRTVTQVSVHSVSACAVLSDGAVRCWGTNEVGELGLGHTEAIGDDEHPWVGGDLQLSGPAKHVAVGAAHACALLTSGEVQCWGHGADGSLGYGSLDNIGDDETPAEVGPLDLGEPALELYVGWRHNCALLSGGRLRCWGFNISGNLGYGHTNTIGDDETLATLGDVALGGEVVTASLGLETSCAVLADGTLRCWGSNHVHALGYTGVENIGDDELPSDLPPVDVGGPVAEVAAGGNRTCALLVSGEIRCWGENYNQGLGIGPVPAHCDEADTCVTAPLCCIGDDESPAMAPAVDIGAAAVALRGGGGATCALTDTGGVRCWGTNRFGIGGRGTTPPVIGDLCYPCTLDPGCCIGDDEDLPGLGDLSFGEPVVQLSVGQATGCVLTTSGAVRCWGYGKSGETGLAMVGQIGDDELPSSVPPVQVVHP